MKYNTARQHRIFILTFMHFNNFFGSSTVGNFIKMARISTFMDQNMQEASLTDPVIAALYAIFHPQHLAFMLLYTTWRGTAGAQHGKVFTKDELIDELESTELATWDLEIQKVYRKGTEEYETLLMNGHYPFINGTIDERIAAILVLANALEAYPLLAALQTTVSAFYTLIFNAEAAVTGKKGNKGSAAGNLETGRVTNAKKMHIMYGNFIALYSGNNTELERYVGTEEIQKKAETNPLVQTILKHLADKVASRTILAGESFEITNTGTVPLKFYLIKKLGDIPSVFVTVLAGQTLTFLATALGNTTFRYIMVQNDSLTTNGSYSFLFID